MLKFGRVAFFAVSLLYFPSCILNDFETAESACPRPNRAQAMAIRGEEALFEGDKAVGAKGDYLLRSDKAAFVISGPERRVTYYHYGGILVDAIPTRRCHQVRDDQFEELGLLFGKLNLGDINASTMRGFRGEKLEIINDGEDGAPAHIRVTGVDDFYWLVEYELIKQTYNADGSKKPSEPYGVKVVVDYILDPGSSVLRIDFTIHNEADNIQRFLAGPEMIVGDLLTTIGFGSSELSIAGFTMRTGIPFLTTGSGQGSYAFGIENANMATMQIAGVNAQVNIDQALARPLQPGPGESATMTMFFAVGEGDDHSAARLLQPYLETPAPNYTYTLAPFQGTVVDGQSGTPISAATILVQLKDDVGEWQTLERYITQEDGHFGDELAVFGVAKHSYRAVVSAEGRNSPAAFEFAPPAEDSLPLVIKMPAAGTLAYTVKDAGGQLIPAKITFFEAGKQVQRWYVMGEGTVAAPPGVYDVSVTRGFEYGTYQGTVTVPEGKTARLNVVLAHLVDTTGYLSADTHVHSAPSPDSQVPIAERIRSAAAEGLEVPVATDHEIIVGLESGIDKTGLADWVNTVTGQEYTATIPEHVTIFPLESDGTPRGGPPTWYLRGLDEMFEAAYGRGATVGFLNHPRGGCSYLCLIEWNRNTAEPGLATMVELGLPATTSVWTWNFQGIEYMNGPKDPFVYPEAPERSGEFDDWQSFLNHGHRIVAIGASDEHGHDSLGMPRIYFASRTDEPIAFRPQDLVDAIYNGDVLVSTGAFARVTVNGSKGMGDLANHTAATVDLDVHIEAIPEIDVTHFRVYVNCDEVRKINTTDPDNLIKYDGTLNIPLGAAGKDATITVIGFGENFLPRGLPQFNPRNIPRFTANAIYIDRNGNGVFDPPGDKTCNYSKD